jgi:hypothetical protein
MQQNKTTKYNGDLGGILKDGQEVQSKLEKVMDLFFLKKQLSIFDDLKEKGHHISTLVYGLIIQPFYGFGNIYNMVKANFAKENKDSYYAAKNNEQIDWRMFLMLFAKKFSRLVNSRDTMKINGTTAIIGDDSTLRKTGKKIERVSMVHDHVTNTFVLGFKILVVGYWDGGSFIPLDFSIHREKGSKLKKAKEACSSAKKAVTKVKDRLTKVEATLQHKQESTSFHRQQVKDNPTNTNMKKLEASVAGKQKTKQKTIELKKALLVKEQQYEQSITEQARVAKKHPEYGLSRKDKKQQFNKKRATGSFGDKRINEMDQSKIDTFISMVKRAVKNGFVPNFVLTDTWFFCQKLLMEIDKMSAKGVKLLSMAKMGNTMYTMVSNGKAHNAQSLIQIFGRKAKYSRKLKAHYIKIPATLAGIRINLFFVKVGGRGKWRLLVTNDLSIGFIKVMEVYQLRWSIEVFFKECKQYLKLGQSCSSDFDGQVADATIAMVQHIMLTFFKRVNYQQSFGDLFKEISSEMVESSLAEKLWESFLQVIRILDEVFKIDIMDIHEETMRNDKAMQLMKQLIFQKSTLKNAA